MHWRFRFYFLKIRLFKALKLDFLLVLVAVQLLQVQNFCFPMYNDFCLPQFSIIIARILFYLIWYVDKIEISETTFFVKFY